MGLGVRKSIKVVPRKQVLVGEAKVEQRYIFDLPLAWVYQALKLRVSGGFDIGTADATSLQTNAMQRLLREIKVIGQFRSGEKVIRSYTHRGVNDAAGGRTASYGGQMLALEELIDKGTPVPKLDPGLTVGGSPNAFSNLFTVEFGLVGTVRPFFSWLDAREGIDALTLEVVLGVIESTAAADDLDQFVLPATSTCAIDSLNIDVEADIREGCDKLPFGLRVVRSVTKALEVNDDLETELGEGRNYRRIIIAATDDDVLSDSRITELEFTVNKNREILQGRWGTLRDEAKIRYGLETMPTGVNVLDHDLRRRGDFFPTAGYADVDLVEKVPAGAAAAADRSFALVEEFVPNVFGRKGLETGKRTRRRARGGRR